MRLFQRAWIRPVGLVAGFVVYAMLVVGCGNGGGAGLFETTCADIGKRPADLDNSVPTEVIVLLDVTSNDAASAKRISDETASVLDTVLAEHDDLIVTGFTSGGADDSIKTIGCMDHAEYFFGGGNVRRQESERKELKAEFSRSMLDAVKSTAVGESGDSRVLLRKVPTVATKPGAKVILWSTFLEQGSDCLTFEQTDNPSEELAASVAKRCSEQGLLPDLSGTDLTIVGAGSGSRPDLAPFGKELARALCSKMTENCDIR